jgi:hypothetical protein
MPTSSLFQNRGKAAALLALPALPDTAPLLILRECDSSGEDLLVNCHHSEELLGKIFQRVKHRGRYCSPILRNDDSIDKYV